MKFLPAQLAYIMHQPRLRRNLGALAKYLLFLGAVIGLYSALFHCRGGPEAAAPAATSS